MEKLNNKFLQWIGALIFALSGAVLSLQLILDTSFVTEKIIITVLVSFISCIFIWRKTNKEVFDEIKNNIGFSIICILFAIGTIGELLLFRKNLDLSGAIINPFRVRYTVVASIAAMYLAIYVGMKIKKWIVDFYKSLDSWERKAYLIATIVSIIIIAVSYGLSNKWFTQQDTIYSIDSNRCWSESILKPNFYEIRHPIISIFTYPVYAIINLAVDLVIPTGLAVGAKAIFMQIINSQLLILIGLQMSKLAKNKTIFILYMLSFSTMLFTMLFEKYQLTAFLVVLYVFMMCTKKESSTASLVSAAGVMPTSCVMGIAELITEDEIKVKLKKILKIVVITLLTFICLGRINVITNGLKDIKAYKEAYSNKEYTFQEKAIASSKMMQNSIIALPSAMVNKNVFGQQVERYWWMGLETDISWPAIAIIALAILGAVVNWKEFYVKLTSIWFAFGFVLIVILNWTPDEAPLFSLYFSWAVVTLFVLGVDCLLKKFKINSKVAYSLIFLFISVINITTMAEVAKYLMIS